jgi:hypothetical protein
MVQKYLGRDMRKELETVEDRGIEFRPVWVVPAVTASTICPSSRIGLHFYHSTVYSGFFSEASTPLQVDVY